MDIQIDKAKINEYNICREISRQFDESTPTKEVFGELVKNKEILVAKYNDIIVGFCAFKRIWNEDFFLQFLRVDKKFHRHGIGTKLIENIEEIAKKNNIYEIFSTATENNVGSIKLHSKLGYKESGYIDFDSGKEIVFVKVL